MVPGLSSPDLLDIDQSYFDPALVQYGDQFQQQYPPLQLEGELVAGIGYGLDFPLGSGLTGAGSAGIEQGFSYELMQRILLTGMVGSRLYVEIDYDSERSRDPLAGEKNIYSMTYLGGEGEFLRDASIGNKDLAIRDSRYFPIDEGSRDSFALRTRSGKGGFFMESLLRYNVAFQGRKEFRGTRQQITLETLDINYAQGRFFLLPDADIEVETLLVYRSVAGEGDLTVDGREFQLLTRGREYQFDNTSGKVYLTQALEQDQELIAYYQKNGSAVGDAALGRDAIIDETGARDDFDRLAPYDTYFDTTGTYLYLRKSGFNSYWEMMNGYYLEEYGGDTLYDLEVKLLYTENSGVNDSYSALLDQHVVDLERGVIFFQFTDPVGFYPRPFPGDEPYPADNPFDPDNPVYGGVGTPEPEDSVNTLQLSYSYVSDIYFLDFNVIPGSVQVTVDGRVVDPQLYTVDFDLGFLNFAPGVVGPSSTVVVTYRYTTMGAGSQSIMGALGLGYESGPFSVYNLTGYQAGLKGREAPDAGAEPTGALVNSTELGLTLGAIDDEPGVYADLGGGFAVSRYNPNVYGSALIADMESGESFTEISLDQNLWLPASTSSVLTQAPYGLVLGTRGNVLYRNYWKDTAASGDVLQTLDWGLPADHIFAYSDKAGPYNTADKPSAGDGKSLVIDYEFSSGDSDAYASVVTPLGGMDVSRFQRLNFLVSARDVTGEEVRVYVELIKEYDEDLDGDGLLDREDSITDAGFSITPEDGGQTTIGTDREGNPDGETATEDLDGDGVLDTPTPETGVVAAETAPWYIAGFTAGDTDWQLVSVDILDLIESDPEVFQYARAFRITVMPAGSPVSADSSGKLLFNRIWFSGSEIVNRSPEYLNLSEVSADDDPDVSQNAFSKTFPGLYDELHGDDQYRSRNDYDEKVLQVSFSPDSDLTTGNRAVVSRVFGSPLDVTSYSELRMYLYKPAAATLPPQMRFVVTLLSSDNQKLESLIDPGLIQDGWNSMVISLDTPYSVSVNGSGAGTMTSYGTLVVPRRLSEVQFGFQAQTADITTAEQFEIWLDEWHLAGSQGQWDHAWYAEASFGHRGPAVYIAGIPLVQDPVLSLSMERRQGYLYALQDPSGFQNTQVDDTDLSGVGADGGGFSGQLDERSDVYQARFDTKLLAALDTSIFLSREETRPFRNQEILPYNLDTGGLSTTQSHSLALDLNVPFVPVLEHSFNRTITGDSAVELEQSDYRHLETTGSDESLEFREHLTLPFGLYQSFNFSRNWLYSGTLTRSPETSPDAASEESASLFQTSDLLLTYSWEANSLDTYFIRDQEYSGDSVPGSGTWLESYSKKLGGLFSTPADNLNNASLTTRTDQAGLGASFPLKETAGFYGSIDTTYTDLNFQQSHSVRDASYSHYLSLAAPFYFLGDNRILITPGLERELSGEYRQAGTQLSEGEILGTTIPYLFMPPFYYINPLPGLGREKDYRAVDRYSSSDAIQGSTENTLYNRYTLDLSLQYDDWFVPSNVGLYLGGETERDGETYQQVREAGASVGKTIPLQPGREWYRRDLTLSLGYETERDYTTKLITHAVSLDTGLTGLRRQYRGFLADHYIRIGRQTQHIGDERLYLFPNDPSGEIPVTGIPDKTTLENELLFQYLWELPLPLSDKHAGGRGEADQSDGQSVERYIRNTELFKVENQFTFTDRERSPSFSNIPVRFTFEHTSDFRMSEFLTFGFRFMTVVGVEEKVYPTSTSGNFIPSMGMELGAELRYLF